MILLSNLRRIIPSTTSLQHYYFDRKIEWHKNVQLPLHLRNALSHLAQKSGIPLYSVSGRIYIQVHNIIPSYWKASQLEKKLLPRLISNLYLQRVFSHLADKIRSSLLFQTQLSCLIYFQVYHIMLSYQKYLSRQKSF